LTSAAIDATTQLKELLSRAADRIRTLQKDNTDLRQRFALLPGNSRLLNVIRLAVNRVRVLEGDNAGLRDDGAKLGTRVQALQGDNDGLRGDAAGLGARVQALQGDNDGLRDDVAELGTRVQALQGDNDGLRDDVAELGTHVEELQGDNDGLRDDVAELGTHVEELQEEVATCQPWDASLMSQQVVELEEILHVPEAATVVQFPDHAKREAGPPAATAEPDSDRGPNLGEAIHAAVPSGGRSTGAAPIDGRFTILVYPFGRFSDLAAFQTALEELPGARDVRVRRFAEGTLEVSVTYDGTVPLIDAIRGLAFPLDSVSTDEPGTILVRVRNRDAA